MSTPLHLAIALDGTGRDPASWREPGARPDELLTAGYWLDQVLVAQRALADLVTFADGMAIRPDGTGHLDSALIAARIAPLTSGVGLVPTVQVTHTEPFHASKTIATLDYVSTGRAGVQVTVSTREDEAALFGRRTAPDAAEAYAEAADHVEVIRRLWDSWEDDAEIRDAATGRFVDRQKLHYIDFEGAHFSVRGPSITPRPPQGQPVVAVAAPLRETGARYDDEAIAVIGRSADIGFVELDRPSDLPEIIGRVRAAQDAAGRADETVHVFVDLAVALGGSGTPERVADLITDLAATGATGVRLHPASNAVDLPLIADGLVPELQARGLFRTEYESATLRGNLGLPRPTNRYALEGSR